MSDAARRGEVAAEGTGQAGVSGVEDGGAANKVEK